jgi:putative membrane protein
MSNSLKKATESTLTIIIGGVSLAVFVVVSVLMLFPRILAFGEFNYRLLPAFHATINTACSVLLVVGYFFIRRKQVALHKLSMVSTFVLSSIFLVSYVIYHANVPSTSFGGEGIIRYVYFFILISHIVLAAVILPLALFTIVRALRNEIDKHRTIARITLPLWLYVTVTGVIVYLMISPYYA